MSHNVTTETLDSLPVLGVGASAAGSSGIRNPTAVTALLPGTFVIPNSQVGINGAPGNTASYRIEGQDSTNGQVPATQAQNQPSVDAIQEVTVQTSNFAAEYGQVGRTRRARINPSRNSTNFAASVVDSTRTPASRFRF